MQSLRSYAHLPIDWNLSPEHAVTMYLEWGNNNWHAEYPPVRSKDDYSNYFVVDTWGERPMIRLVRRNSENAEDVVSLEIPETLMGDLSKEFGKLRGVFEPPEAVKEWLKKEIEH